MKVIFGLSMPEYKVTSVTWKDAGVVNVRTLITDGSVKDRQLADPSMYSAWTTRFSSHYPPHPVEVADIRTAFKYLGKMSDLVELLPDVTFTPDE